MDIPSRTQPTPEVYLRANTAVRGSVLLTGKCKHTKYAVPLGKPPQLTEGMLAQYRRAKCFRYLKVKAAETDHIIVLLSALPFL